MKITPAVKRQFVLGLACLIAGILIGTEMESLSSIFRCRVREVSFAGPAHHAIVGKIYYPTGLFRRKYHGILFCHGVLPRGKDTSLYVYLMRRLARKGYLVLIFDLRGFGESAKVANFRVPGDCNYVAETKAALSYMLRELPVDREHLTIAGHSMGANLALAVGAADDRVRNIIVISAGNFVAGHGDAAGAKTPLCRRFENMVKHDVSPQEWSRITRPLDLFQYLPIPGRKNILVALADDDAPSIIHYNRAFYERLNTPKELVIIRDSDHNFGFDMASANEMIDPSAGIRLVQAMDRWLSPR